jgi:hypothetical protein
VRAGSAPIPIGVTATAAAPASLPRSSGSGSAVSVTSALTSISHSARCWVARAFPSAALARERAAVAGDWKPASVVSWVRRAVSAREAASWSATASSCSQVRSA